MRGAVPCLLLALTTFAFLGEAQEDCNALECCETSECFNRNAPDGIVSRECLQALADLNLESGQGRACSTCITSSIATDIGQIDGTPENFSDLVNKDALKSCCGLNCPELLMEYQRVIQGVCSDSALPSIPSVFTTIKDMIGDVCNNIVEDWPYDPLCAPRRQDSGADNGRMAVCAAHNDPHIKRFNSSMSMQTCNSTGTMVLLDNDYITVSSQTEPVPTAEGAQVGGASVITAVTFTYKHANCSMFANGKKSLTVNGAMLRLRNTTVHTFREPKLWTTVHVRMSTMLQDTPNSKDYLSVRILTPYFAGSGVCVDGCPADDLVDLSSFFGRRKLLSTVTEQEAKEACEQAGVNDEYLQTCMFDVQSTGDKEAFTASASTSSQEYKQAVVEADEDTDAFKKSLEGSGASALAAAQGFVLSALLGVAAVLLV
mmetsp:Transcript_7520/g.20011  ORF Transcript_7520/g.20011 Transcript_7520/m.20011 type:complete len:430 (+) Transcript_7520:64-1353(+)